MTQAAEFQAGKEYVELSSPVPVADPSKIEVVELFWYGCPHCYQFEPVIKPWAEKLPEDVQFKRIPAMFGGIWNAHGQLFVTLESMGVEPKVHDAVFAAYHQERKKLATPEEMADFLEGHGVDKQAFLKAYNSFGVRGRVEQAKKLGMAYQITGVPVMIVNGKYRFDLGSSGGPERTLQVADFLIEKNAQRGNPACCAVECPTPCRPRQGTGQSALPGQHRPAGRWPAAPAQLQHPGWHQHRALPPLPDAQLAASAAPSGRAGNLQRIGEVLGNYDLVALQEADGGSLRSGYVNQVEHLAHLGAFPYWYQQLNRNLGRFAQHSNGCLAAWSPRAWRTTRYLGRRDAARSCCVLARARTRWWW